MDRHRSGIRVAFAALGALAVVIWGPRLVTDGHRLAVAVGPAAVAAASPEPSAPGGDTRSPGEGPGLVGAPFLAVLGVVGLGLVTAGATLVYLRLSSGPGPGAANSPRPRGPAGPEPRTPTGPGRRRTR